MKRWIILFITLFVINALAEDYPIFDGQFYNGLFYPRIDVVEWADKGQPYHMEFHIYKKDKPIEISGQVVDKGKYRVFMHAVDLTYRGERRCRSALTPADFKEGQQLYYYFDPSDKDMNRVIISQTPKTGQKAYKMKPFKECVEVAAHSEAPKRVVASEPKKAPATAPAPSTPEKPPSEPQNHTGKTADGSLVPDGGEGFQWY
jgi:hypothetical protein